LLSWSGRSDGRRFRLPEAAEGVDFEGSGDEFAADFAADVVLDGFDDGLAGAHEAGLVVIELHVVGEKSSELLQVAAVVGVEDGGVEGGDGAEEVVFAGFLGLGEEREREEDGGEDLHAREYGSGGGMFRLVRRG